MHVAFLQAVCYNNEKICKTYCRSQQSFRGTAAVCAYPLRPHTYKPRSVFPEAHVLGKNDLNLVRRWDGEILQSCIGEQYNQKQGGNLRKSTKLKLLLPFSRYYSIMTSVMCIVYNI